MYKPSTKNYFINHQDKIIYYNAFTRNSFALTTKEHEKMQSYFADPITFELEFPSVFEVFRKQGFFVDSSIDEDILYRYRYYKDITYSKDFHLIIDFEYPENEIELAWLIKHIEQALCNTAFTFVCIEWKGREIEKYMDTWIIPLTSHIQQLCESYGYKYQFQFKKNIEENKEWYYISGPRINQYTIQNSGEVYAGYALPGKNNRWGRLSADGVIEWDEEKKEIFLAMPWFDAEGCMGKCKDYMLYGPLCAHFRQQHIKVCLRNDNNLNPEKIIIDEFESKTVTK